jgi:CMP-N-acetylneuraminic acid synthetase
MSSQQGVGGGGSGNNAVDFDLPDEILAVIPTDPYHQLDLARKITSMAIASRVSSLESDTGRLRQMLLEKDRVINDLEDRVSTLTRASQQAHSALNNAVEQNVYILNSFLFYLLLNFIYVIYNVYAHIYSCYVIYNVC